MPVKTKKEQLKAMLYEMTRHPDGSVTLRPVTSALYLTVPMIAATLNIAKQTVYRAVDAGDLPALRFGSCVRVEVEAYRKWVENSRYAEYDRPMRKEDMRG